MGSCATTHEISIDGPLREYYLRNAGDTPGEAGWRTEFGWRIFAVAPDGAVVTLAASGLPPGGGVGVESTGFVPPGFGACGAA